MPLETARSLSETNLMYFINITQKNEERNI